MTTPPGACRFGRHPAHPKGPTVTYTDSKGRTPADRIAAVAARRTTPPTADELETATALLVDLLAAAERHGVTLDDLDWVADLPGAAYDATVAKLRKHR